MATLSNKVIAAEQTEIERVDYRGGDHPKDAELDGVSLLSTACASIDLSSLASQDNLWRNVCRSTWPSTDLPCLQDFISAFPGGHRSFFSASFPLVASNMEPHAKPPAHSQAEPERFTEELISSMDIYHRRELIFNRATETASSWFRSSPFWVDLLDPNDTCLTWIPRFETEGACGELEEELTLSWVLIDLAGRRAVNVSSHRPISVLQRHWLSGTMDTLCVASAIFIFAFLALLLMWRR
ncbi:unnamed protein product [Linum trigynum]|uniref:Uncharacterized protein n=1 Tax=Linum trigynum TaxID=586398 RepID=A0AAV2FA72_9ROSI